jgi:hypothetical protein
LILVYKQFVAAVLGDSGIWVKEIAQDADKQCTEPVMS